MIVGAWWIESGLVQSGSKSLGRLRKGKNVELVEELVVYLGVDSDAEGQEGSEQALGAVEGEGPRMHANRLSWAPHVLVHNLQRWSSVGARANKDCVDLLVGREGRPVSLECLRKVRAKESVVLEDKGPLVATLDRIFHDRDMRGGNRDDCMSWVPNQNIELRADQALGQHRLQIQGRKISAVCRLPPLGLEAVLEQLALQTRLVPVEGRAQVDDPDVGEDVVEEAGGVRAVREAGAGHTLRVAAGVATQAVAVRHTGNGPGGCSRQVLLQRQEQHLGRDCLLGLSPPGGCALFHLQQLLGVHRCSRPLANWNNWEGQWSRQDTGNPIPCLNHGNDARIEGSVQQRALTLPTSTVRVGVGMLGSAWHQHQSGFR
mmetsp:Transcript_26104/g.60244  ORF Transcript_26104/g.60244 Transcript_26104/m.60244 type:complete len:374 (-) Transcript_26104:1109-2230(-)